MEFGPMTRQLHWIWDAPLERNNCPCGDSALRLKSVSWRRSESERHAGRSVKEFQFPRERRRASPCGVRAMSIQVLGRTSVVSDRGCYRWNIPGRRWEKSCQAPISLIFRLSHYNYSENKLAKVVRLPIPN